MLAAWFTDVSDSTYHVDYESNKENSSKYAAADVHVNLPIMPVMLKLTGNLDHHRPVVSQEKPLSVRHCTHANPPANSVCSQA